MKLSYFTLILASIGLAGVVPNCLYAAPPTLKKPAAKPFDPNTPVPDEIVAVLDEGQDGMIDDQEAGMGASKLQKLSRTKTALGKSILSAFDANGDKRLDDDEARAAVGRAKSANRGVSQEVAAIFDSLDTDHDTRISVGEFKQLVGKLGIVGLLIQPQLGEFFNRMDRDHDGQISPAESQRGAEFLQQEIERAQQGQAAAAKNKDPFYQQAQQLFAALDRNGDQLLTKKELQRNKELTSGFLQADKNLDSQLSLDEVAAYLASRKKR